MSEKAKKRLRYGGTAEELAAALCTVAKSRKFIVYNEAKVKKAALVDKVRIAEYHELLSALHGLQANLSFPNDVLRKELGQKEK